MAWQPLKLGAGGQLSGLDIAADGTMVVRADTYGAYWWNGSSWIQLFTANSIPAVVVADPYSYIYATYEIRIAPTNTSRFYMYNYLSIYTTTNKGTTWSQTNFNNGVTSPFNSITVAGADASDGGTKFLGPFLAIDPFNELICYVGTPGKGFGSSTNAQGVFVTTDGGTTWSQISTATIAAGTGIPIFSSGQQGGNNIAFDPTSSHPGNVTQTIYISSYGTGVYKTTNGGGSWSLLNSAGMPTNVLKMYVGPDSRLYCIDYNTYNILVYDSSWHTYTTGTAGSLLNSIAFDPGNASHLVAVTQDGVMSTSTGGFPWTTWSGYQANDSQCHRTATDIPWLGEAYGNYMTSAAIVFDPTQSNVLYNAAGVGVWKTSNTTITTPASDIVTWTSQSVGIEQLVVNWIISPPTGNPIVACFDRPIFTISGSLSNYPSSYGPSYPGSVFEGYSCDWASATPGTIVALVSDPTTGINNATAVSSVGGGAPASWTLNTSHTPLGNPGGSIAASTTTNFMVATQGGGLYYTTNAAASAWTSPTITGGAITNTDSGWYTFSARLKIQNICADRVLSNTFYAYNSGTTAPGMYVSTDSGANFSKKFTGHVVGSSLDTINFQMRAVPGQSGNFYSACGANVFSNVTPFDEWIWNGSTLTRNSISNVATVWSFGFGKVKPGNTYPSVYIYGKVGSTVGVFRSDDHCVSWTQLAGSLIPDWPVGSLGTADQVDTVEGDANTYGTVYVGFGGSGAAYFALDVGASAYGFSVITDSGQRRTRMIGY